MASSSGSAMAARPRGGGGVGDGEEPRAGYGGTCSEGRGRSRVELTGRGGGGNLSIGSVSHGRTIRLGPCKGKGKMGIPLDKKYNSLRFYKVYFGWPRGSRTT